jgi:IS30 family transposase
LVERSTRFVMLVALPGGHKADLVAAALAAKITTLPAALTRTLTWDQGHEMAEHVRFTEETGVEVYFCDPRSPWQRGSNENTNGLLRQYLPRTLDFRTLTQADFDTIADKLNGRPRQTLGFKTLVFPEFRGVEIAGFWCLTSGGRSGTTGVPGRVSAEGSRSDRGGPKHRRCCARSRDQ